MNRLAGQLPFREKMDQDAGVDQVLNQPGGRGPHADTLEKALPQCQGVVDAITAASRDKYCLGAVREFQSMAGDYAGKANVLVLFEVLGPANLGRGSEVSG